MPDARYRMPDAGCQMPDAVSPPALPAFSISPFNHFPHFAETPFLSF
jgi:hypothetical protein